MDEQEAIEILTLSDDAKEQLPMLAPVYEVAVKALQKQIPKKPREYEDKYYACECGNVLMEKWEQYPVRLMPKRSGLPYCLCCGQKLDWREENEHD